MNFKKITDLLDKFNEFIDKYPIMKLFFILIGISAIYQSLTLLLSTSLLGVALGIISFVSGIILLRNLIGSTMVGISFIIGFCMLMHVFYMPKIGAIQAISWIVLSMGAIIVPLVMYWKENLKNTIAPTP